MDTQLISVNLLQTYFHTEAGVVKAVDGVSFSLNAGQTLGIVGESGCGKSVTALSIMRLIPSPPGRIESGEVVFEGEDILKLPKAALRKIRGNKISMIFQEPMTSLNPVFRIGEQITEAIRLHQGLSKKEAFQKSIEMLQLVGIPSPHKRVYNYPHQMSGGMRQRVMIAMAMSCRPRLMIADEPTTALDVTIQAQILNLMQILKEETGMSIMLITHNMGVIAETAQNVIVMYAGKIVEQATVIDLFKNACHPYTEGLLRSIPRLDRIQKRGR
jgi:ABC-type dipeptide/oligopeptide/nickel transport system ATPase component